MKGALGIVRMDDDDGTFIPSHRPCIALIIALALVFVILGFAAYSIFLVAKWLIGLVW